MLNLRNCTVCKAGWQNLIIKKLEYNVLRLWCRFNALKAACYEK